MSHLLQTATCEISCEYHLEAAPVVRTSDDDCFIAASARDDDWERFWTDVGGEG